MTHRTARLSIWTGLLTSVLLVWAPGSLAAEKIIWLLRGPPPLTIVDGTQKGQGLIDNLMPVLIANMPQYQHVIVRVNRARAIQMLEKSSLTCDPTLIWSPTRAHSIVYSTPIAGIPANGLVIRREDQPQIAPYVQDQKVDLQAMLKAHALKLGIIAKRSYGVWIDGQLSESPQGQVFIHHGSDPMDSLLQMQHAGRLQAVLGYWIEIQMKAAQQGLSPEALVFYPIQGSPTYQPIYVGCSNTPEGREAIRSINIILANHRKDPLNIPQWLGPEPSADHQNASQDLPASSAGH